ARGRKPDGRARERPTPIGARGRRSRAHGGGGSTGGAMRGVRERRLAALVRRLRGVRVLVVGDLMLDQFIWGRVERISPEAPVPVVHVTHEDLRPGGAGNVVSNIVALGGRATVAGIVGRDAAGTRLRAALEDLGADTGGVVATRETSTIRKTRIIAHHQQV